MEEPQSLWSRVLKGMCPEVIVATCINQASQTLMYGIQKIEEYLQEITD